MKAIKFDAPGGPEVLKPTQWLQPGIQHPREILVQLHAAGVNPIDTKLRKRGTFYPEQMPAVLGCDGAGIVTAVGGQVQRFQIGDAIYFCHGGLGKELGTYAEYAVVDERFCAPKPKSLSFAEAAAAPLVLITAWEALYDRGRLQANQTVLIHAGAGGVGHVALQLAQLQGARVITTVGSQEKVKFVLGLGAETAILYPQVDVVPAVLDLTAGEGVDLAFDTVGGAILTQCFSTVRYYGEVVTLLAPDPKTEWSVARTRNLRVGYELMLTPQLQGLMVAQQHHAEILTQCAQWFDAGKLKIHLNKTFPLYAAAEAHQQLEQGSMLGKIALTISP